MSYHQTPRAKLQYFITKIKNQADAFEHKKRPRLHFRKKKPTHPAYLAAVERNEKIREHWRKFRADQQEVGRRRKMKITLPSLTQTKDRMP